MLHPKILAAPHKYHIPIVIFFIFIWFTQFRMAHNKDLLLRHAALAPANGGFNVTPNETSNKIFNVMTKPMVPRTVTATTKATASLTATTTTKATAPLTATTRIKPTYTTLTTNIILNMMTQRSSGQTADSVAATMPSRKEKVARSVNDGYGLLHRHQKIDVNADQTSTGQAIEPSCIRVNMLQCEHKCYFPLVGGHHRSSNDSPGLTATLPFPVWCHVNKSNTPSLMRTCVAGAAYLSSSNHPPSRSTSHRR